MSTSEKLFTSLGIGVSYLVTIALLGCLLAFPIKWCWNYTIPTIFHLTEITWGQAWCLDFLATNFIKSLLINYSEK